MNIFTFFIVNESYGHTAKELNDALEEIKNNGGEILRQMEATVKHEIAMQEKHKYDPSSKYYSPRS